MEQLELPFEPSPKDQANAALLLDQEIHKRLMDALRSPEGQRLVDARAQVIAEQVVVSLLQQMGARMTPTLYPTYTTTWSTNSGGVQLPNPSRSFW